jgi:putative membrane protein
MQSDKKSMTVHRTDQDFMKKAAEGGMAEVALGELAAKQGSNEDVKKFGQRMVDDHSKANRELMDLASQKGVTLPTEPNAQQKSEKAKMEKLSGANFDREYMRAMVKDHDKDVAEFEKLSRTAHDADLKAWAGKTLPTLQEHQKMAHEVAGKVGAGKPASNAVSKKDLK